VRTAAGGTTVDERVEARVKVDDVAERKGPLAKKSRFKTFWAEPGPEGEATVMVESVWPMFGFGYGNGTVPQMRNSKRYRSMGEREQG
jgi:hypothetical protein